MVPQGVYRAYSGGWRGGFVQGGQRCASWKLAVQDGEERGRFFLGWKPMPREGGVRDEGGRRLRGEGWGDAGLRRDLGEVFLMMTATSLVAILLASCPAACAEREPLTVHDVGEYAAVPWGEPGAEIEPGTRAERVKDLSFAVSSVNLQGSDDVPPELVERWANLARWGREQGKKLLPRVYFWDGADRYQGEMRDIEVYWGRLDQFLGGVNLENFHGIVLAEENVHYGGRPEVLTELYRRVKAKYDIPVWQWWSPQTAVPGSGGWIPADGWVVDPYFKPKHAFRRYLRKYLITGLPVVVMPWADDSRELTDEQWQANTDQVEAAVEFGLPVAFYWVAGTTCHFGGARDANETLMDTINHMVWDYTGRVRALPGDYVGLPSADLAEGDVLEIGPTEGLDFVYTDDFSVSKCVDHASMTGFRDWVLDGKTLAARGFLGRKTDATLTYRFEGEFACEYPGVSLSATADRELSGRVRLALSRDGKRWEHQAATAAGNDGELTASSAGDKAFASLKAFYVRVSVTGDPGTTEAPVARINDLQVKAAMLPVAEPLARLRGEDGSDQEIRPTGGRARAGSSGLETRPTTAGALVFEDTFETRKYVLTAEAIEDEHLEWEPGQLGVRLRPGGSKPSITWRVTSERPVRAISVALAGRANNGSLGTNHYVDVSLDGETWTHTATSEGRETDANGWVRELLSIDLTDEQAYTGIREFYVRLRMVAGGHREVHRALSGVVTGLWITAQPGDRQ